MLMTLILAATIGQTPSWCHSTNHPEWEAFGVAKDGRIDPQRWRLVADRSVEFIRDGDPVPNGYVRTVQDRTGATGDQYGFVSWLCAQRAAVGLPGVAWDDGMAGAAAANNALQVVYGIGHWTMAGARVQNSAMMGYPALLNAWMNSSGHRAALLDPTVRWVGIAFSGAYATFSAR